LLLQETTGIDDDDECCNRDKILEHNTLVFLCSPQIHLIHLSQPITCGTDLTSKHVSTTVGSCCFSSDQSAR
jgi:hypothetical protein